MPERWMPVPGWEDCYSVSDCGRVRSEARTVLRRNGRIFTVREYILKPQIHQSGHPLVRLSEDGRGRTYTVHLLVMEAFVGPRPADMETRHLDGNAANNNLSNLCYGTRSENIYDQVRHGVHINGQKSHCKNGHPFTPDNTRVRKRLGGGRQCKQCEHDRQNKRDAA